MKNKQTTLIVGAFLIIASIAWSSTPEPDQAKVDAGKKIFMTTCFACHGVDGKGLVPGTPDLTNDKSPLLQESAVLKERVLKGYQSKGSLLAMPPMGGNPALKENEIDDVLVFMKSTFLKKK